MEKKIITLPSNNNIIYRQILAFLNFTLGISNQERNVLAELIKLNHEYSPLPIKKRAKFILSTDMRKEMREALEIEEKQFNVVVHNLKKKKYLGEPILNDDNVIHQGLLFKPDNDGFQIEVNLINTVVEETLVKEPIVDETIPLKTVTEKPKKEKKLAKSANGTDGIIENDFKDIVIS